MRTNNKTPLKKGLALAVSLVLAVSLLVPTGVLAEEIPAAALGTITEFTPLAEAVTVQTVPEGTAVEALALPETLTATVETAGTESGTPETAPQELAVSWQSDPAYDGGTAESYVFTPTLPEGYTLLEGLSLPQITVTVGTSEELPAGETEETPTETVPITPFSSSDASLLKVAGLTISTTGGDGTSGTPYTAAVTVPNSITQITTSNLVAAAGASVELAI